jgi:hypothetical protein
MEKIMVSASNCIFEGGSKLKSLICVDADGYACDSFMRDLAILMIEHGIGCISGGEIEIISAKILSSNALESELAINMRNCKLIGNGPNKFGVKVTGI